MVETPHNVPPQESSLSWRLSPYLGWRFVGGYTAFASPKPVTVYVLALGEGQQRQLFGECRSNEIADSFEVFLAIHNAPNPVVYGAVRRGQTSPYPRVKVGVGSDELVVNLARWPGVLVPDIEPTHLSHSARQTPEMPSEKRAAM